MTTISYRKVDVDGHKIFYREAGRVDGTALLLLHGFPSASHMFRDLIPLLADRFHLVAPDLPGFGQSDMPPRSGFTYTFDRIAAVIDHFTEVINLRRLCVRLRGADRVSHRREAPGPNYRDHLAEWQRL